MKPLINKKFILEKMQGKGGWTFVRIPGISKDKRGRFGTVKVKGTIDAYEINKYHLMPMKSGELFLPIKAEIRKQIKKKEGDTVHIILYADDEPLEAPEEMLTCLKEEPKALKFFISLTESEKKYYIQWIYSAKKEETKINRLAKTIDRLLLGLKMFDKDE